MNNFGVLYRYECKKLLGRKIVWISFLLCVIIAAISLLAPFLGEYYIDGKFVDTNYNMCQTDMGYAEALDGREIGQNLLEETMEAYGKIPQIQGRHYTSTEEYQRYARPYSGIFNFIRGMTNMNISEALAWQPSEENLYEKRQLWQESLWEKLGLSEGEMHFWREREAKIRTPYVYRKNEGYAILLVSFQTVGIFELLLIAICLAGMFFDEHARKTDQIILCSPLGKTKLYWAKVAAGVSFAVASTVLLFVFVSVITVCLYGAEEFGGAFQLIYAENSDPVTCGQAILIAYGNMVITAVLIGIFVMVLSELLRSNIAVLAVSVGLMFMAMIVTVPEQYRAAAQIWDWFPWCFLAPWNVFGKYTVSLFGRYLTPWQAAPVIYLAVGVVIAAGGKKVYGRFQVSGR